MSDTNRRAAAPATTHGTAAATNATARATPRWREIRRLAEGGRLGDYLPHTGWFHFPLADPNPDEFFNETVDTTERFGWDIVKIMTNGNYLPIAYGADYDYSTDPHKWDGVFHSHPIASETDAATLPALDATNPTLAAEAAVDGRIARRFAGDRPIIATLFDPLSWAQELSTPLDARYVRHLIDADPKALRHALESIQLTNEHFLAELFKAGVDGVFFTTKFSTSELLTPAEHAEFVLPYLRRTAEVLKGHTWLNLLHVHGVAGLYLDDLVDLDFNAINWESVGEGATSVAELRAKTDKLLITGVDNDHDFAGSRARIRERLHVRLADTLEGNDGGPLVFGPGCALPLDVDRSLFSLIGTTVSEAGLSDVTKLASAHAPAPSSGERAATALDPHSLTSTDEVLSTAHVTETDGAAQEVTSA